MAAALPMATALGTFSVPGRRSRSCLPPNWMGRSLVPFFTYSAPMPLGAVKLVAADGVKIHAERFDIDGDFARRLHAVGMHQRAGLGARWRRFRRSAGARRSRCWRASRRPERSRAARRGEYPRDRPRRPDRDGHRSLPRPMRSSSRQGFSTAGCSMAVVMTCLSGRRGMA